jgi:peptidoglycan/LPS O-acetylase OafA/YrhL
LFVAQPAWFPLAPNDQVTRELALLFALGSLAWCWRARIVVSLTVAAAALAVVAWNPAGIGRGALLEPLLAYVVLVAAYHPRLQWPAFNRTGDYSYGLYVYSFPIQQLLVQLLPGATPARLFALALPAALVVAALSWHVVEKPALGLKSRFHRPAEDHA